MAGCSQITYGFLAFGRTVTVGWNAEDSCVVVTDEGVYVRDRVKPLDLILDVLSWGGLCEGVDFNFSNNRQNKWWGDKGRLCMQTVVVGLFWLKKKKIIYIFVKKKLYAKLTYCDYLNKNFEHSDVRITKI